MKKTKSLFIATLILSASFLLYGLYTMIIDSEYLLGFIHISLGFALGIQDWITLFKRKSE